MARIDNAAAIRDRAYDIWMKEGCPSGREHHHWAQATLEIEQQQAASAASEPIIYQSETVEVPDGQEIERLRRALWEPDHFDYEMFGKYAPPVEPALSVSRPAG